MPSDRVTTLPSADLLEPTSRPLTRRPAEGALGPYLRAIRAHRLVVGLIILVALGGAIAYLATRSPTYEAKAEILVSPLPQDDTTFLGIQVLRDTPGDPTRVVQTAATLLDSPLAAKFTAQKVGRGYTPAAVRNDVTVQPEGQADILAITAEASDPKVAAALANQFATAALRVRGQTIRQQIQAQILQLQARLKTVAPGDTASKAAIAGNISTLQGANKGTDPSLSLLQPAAVPGSPTGAPAWLVVALALLAGVMLGTGTALLIEMLDRRIRDVDELLSIYPLPVLARVPKLPRRLVKGSAESSPMAMPPAVREAFRTLLVQLEQRPGQHRTIMVTSATSRDGKTTSAINLAFALVGAGHRVILIDFDLRKPDVGAALNVNSTGGLLSLLADNVNFADLLVPAPQLPPLRVVPAGTEGDVVLLEALSRRLPDLLKQAKELADYVILDTAPLGEVSDALRLADEVDDLIIVSRPGHTMRANFEIMRDLLEQTGHEPLGYLLLGVTGGITSAYYTYGLPQRKDGGSRSRLARSAAR